LQPSPISKDVHFPRTAYPRKKRFFNERSRGEKKKEHPRLRKKKKMGPPLRDIIPIVNFGDALGEEKGPFSPEKKKKKRPGLPPEKKRSNLISAVWAGGYLSAAPEQKEKRRNSNGSPGKEGNAGPGEGKGFFPARNTAVEPAPTQPREKKDETVLSSRGKNRRKKGWERKRDIPHRPGSGRGKSGCFFLATPPPKKRKKHSTNKKKRGK